MGLLTGQQIVQSDFQQTSPGSPNIVPKSASDGKIDGTWIRRSFGGTGSDGARTFDGTTVVAGITPVAGVYTFNLGNAMTFVMNFTSISITGTASVVFTNPNANGTSVIFRCQGNCTITSTTNPCIDLRLLGASGGTGGTNGLATAGYGGIGGGALLLEVGGALNFTGTINASGQAGQNSPGTNLTGGGGGGGGTIWIIANTITTNTGTLIVTAGSTGTNSGSAGGGSTYSGNSGKNANGLISILPGGAQGGVSTPTSLVGILSSNALMTRYIPLFPGAGGGGGTWGSTFAAGNTGTGASGATVGFGAVVANSFFV